MSLSEVSGAWNAANKILEDYQIEDGVRAAKQVRRARQMARCERPNEWKRGALSAETVWMRVGTVPLGNNADRRDVDEDPWEDPMGRGAKLDQKLGSLACKIGREAVGWD